MCVFCVLSTATRSRCRNKVDLSIYMQYSYALLNVLIFVGSSRRCQNTNLRNAPEPYRADEIDDKIINLYITFLRIR